MNNAQNIEQQDAMTMADLLARFSPTTIKRHTLVEGEIVAITREGALVHCGAKSESIINPDEVAELGLAVGHKGSFFVVSDADENGSAFVSLKAARAWEELRVIKDANSTVTVTVKSLQTSRGTTRVAGAIAIVCGLRGFIPASQLSGRGNALNKLVGKEIAVKVIEADPTKDRSSIVLSQRKADEEMQETFFAGIKHGDIVAGSVTGFGKKTIGEREECYGAFVDLGFGISGLVHKSELSGNRALQPEEVVSAGQELELVVLSVDAQTRKIGLSLKQASQMRALTAISKGQVVVGKVARKTDFGAFIDLGGIDGLLHVSEIPGGSDSPRQALEGLTIGSEIKLAVIEFKPESKRVGLSLIQLPAADPGPVA